MTWERAVIAVAAALAVVAIVVGATTSNTAVAGALAVLSPVSVIAYQSVQTRLAVDASRAEADASRQLANEAQRDRELALQPFVTGKDNSSQSRPQVSLRNIGRGPAIQLRVLLRRSGSIHWNSAAVLLAASESLPPPVSSVPTPMDAFIAPAMLHFDRERDASGVRSYIVDETQPHDLAAYCLDQLGNWLRFNLRTGEPPKMWRPGDPPPEWAGFRDYQ